MKKISIIVGILMLTILASCGKTDDTSSESASSSSVIAQETSSPAEPLLSEDTIEEPVVLGQGFVEYDESYLGESDSTVLFFHSAGCGSCRATEASLKETGVSNGATVLKVDFDADENFELRKKYGVTKYHTFVQVDADGNEIKKWSGSLSDADIQEQLGGDSMMQKDEEADNETMEKSEEVMENKEASNESGKYVAYSADMIGTNDSTVLFFHASWCPSCQAADASISASEIPAGLTVLKADFDSEIELRKEYGVVAQHTFVLLDAEGNQVKKWVGGTSIDDIVEKL